MNEKNINKSSSFLRVLVAPLDWGLGHATRCIPIIHTLLHEKVIVYIAAEGAILNLFQKEFHNVTFLNLSGYKISYPIKKGSFVVKLLTQIPKILRTIRHEKKWLNGIILEHSIDAVISDNRFGLYNSRIKSIYITHQLHIETGKIWMNKLAQKIHYSYINRYDACWVPDAAGEINLAGKLAHPQFLPETPVKYSGPLSRFKKRGAEKKYDLLILLSGPEPQRTLLEELLLQQIKKVDLSIVFVRGLPSVTTTLSSEKNNVVFYNHLPSEELSLLIQQAQLVLCRSGYSTVMDLAALQQKAILVPTPGQTEQEYLADYLEQKQLFFSAAQEGFDLATALKNAAQFGYLDFPVAGDHLKEMITGLLAELKPVVPQ